MKPTEISLELKFSREMKDGIWRGIQVGATANLDPQESVEEGIARLYPQLKKAGSIVWGDYHRQRAQTAQEAVGDPEIEELPAPPPEPDKEPDTAWCEVHDCQMQRYSGKTGGSWYAHQTIDDESGKEYWCHGKPKKYCRIHDTMMDQRSWGGFSHKVDNRWCNGSAPQQPTTQGLPDEEEIPF